MHHWITRMIVIPRYIHNTLWYIWQLGVGDTMSHWGRPQNGENTYNIIIMLPLYVICMYTHNLVYHVHL